MKTMLIKKGKTNLKYLLIVIILAAIAGGGILWYMKEQIKFQENIIQASCNMDSDCQFYCGCGCVLKNTPGCPNPNFAREYDSCNSCRCLNGQCVSWSEVFIEAQQKKDINLCQGIENEECKKQCLEVLTNLLEEDETADWETYRNEEYGFEMKYPKNWAFLYDIDHVVDWKSDEEIKNCCDNCSFAIHVYNKEDNLSLSEWAHKQFDVPGEENIVSEIKVNNLNLIKHEDNDYRYGNLGTRILFKKDKTIVSIFTSFELCRSTEVFNQILSTFRFLE